MATKEKEIALQLRGLAADPENRPYIIKQGCLPGLVLFLNNSDPEIVVIALEAMEFMTLYKGHKSVMATEEGLAPALRKLMLSPNAHIKRLAIAVYGNIQDNLPQKEQATPAARPHVEETPPTPVGKAIETTKMSSARTYHVYIKDLTTDQLKAQIENCLLSVKGVLSFLIDLYARKAVVRSMTPPDVLTSALKSAGFFVLKVDEHGDPNKAYKTPSEDKENSAQSQNAGGGWFGWLVTTDTQSNANNEGGWFGGGKKRAAKKEENAGVMGRMGKLLWG